MLLFSDVVKNIYNKYFIRKYLTGRLRVSARDINILNES